jgi:uncharacterized phiE125 gp8 family phage protein
VSQKLSAPFCAARQKRERLAPMPIVQVTQPASFPVTLAEALTTCRLNLGDADADVTALIGVATDFVENYILRAIMPRTFALYAGSFPETFRLTRGPATAISSLVYVDAAGVSQSLIHNYLT